MKVALIPAYNEEGRIAPIILKASRHVDMVIVCDDGSEDFTSEVAKKMGAKVVKHSKNMGYGAALKTLFWEALKIGADAAVTLDADGQHDPDQIPALIEPILNGEADVVIGSRFVKGGSTPGISRYRMWALKLLNFFGSKVTGLNIRDTQSGMRAYSRKALEISIRAAETGMGVSLGILNEIRREGLKVKEVPITVSYVGNRPSKHPIKHFSELVAMIIKIVLLERPLKILGGAGLALIMVAFFFTWWALNLYLATGYFSVPMALISLGGYISGILSILGAFQLYSLAKVREELIEMRKRMVSVLGCIELFKNKENDQSKQNTFN